MRKDRSFSRARQLPVRVLGGAENTGAPSATNALRYWPQWRGRLPTGLRRWQSARRVEREENVRWKIALPGQGHFMHAHVLCVPALLCCRCGAIRHQNSSRVAKTCMNSVLARQRDFPANIFLSLHSTGGFASGAIPLATGRAIAASNEAHSWPKARRVFAPTRTRTGN